MFMSRHRLLYKYRLSNSVRHLSVLHTNLLLTVLLSQSRTEGMVLYSLGRSPCSCLSLQWQPTAAKGGVSIVSCLPGSLPLLIRWLSSLRCLLLLLRGKGEGKRVKRRAVFTSLYQVSTLLRYMNAYECVSAYPPGAWDGMWEHPYTFPSTFLYTLLWMQLEGRTDLSALSVLVADTCWRTTLDPEDTPEQRVIL